jgi:DtxR family transcriptional regulator, Mn-dependent transcriptional regulator
LQRGIVASRTVENYLKAIVQIAMRTGSKSVSTGDLASALEVLPGTVTSMLKTLAESKLAHYTPYEGVVLTESGRKLALRMLRRHRLIELFLVQTLNLPWDQVHDEAEQMEHAVSDRLIDRIDEFLGKPDYDPHGDPIPASDGSFRGRSSRATPLTDCAPRTRVKLVRVLNHGPDFLRFLSDSGLAVGVVATVASNSAEAGTVHVKLNGRPVTLGYPAAEKLLVERLGG